MSHARLSICVLCAVIVPLPAAAAAKPGGLSLLEAPKLEQPATELLPSLRVELPPVKVELPLLPTVELSSTTVEVAPPKVEASLPKVEVSQSPPQASSTPTGSTPAPTPPPVDSPSPGGETSGTSGGGATGGGEKTAAGNAPVASAASVSRTDPAANPAAVAAAEPTRRSRPSSAHRRPSPHKPIGAGAATRPLAVSNAGSARSVAGSTDATSSSAKETARAPAAGASNPLDALGRNIPIPLPVPDWSKPVIVLLLLTALWFGARSRVADQRARRLEGQRDVLLQDLDVMQATLVPVIPRRIDELAVSVAYRPADGPAAGGDFYDVFELESGKVAVLLGDVAGHGHEALTQAALTRYTLRAYLQAGLEPRGALALAGSVLADAAAAHYATVVVGVYDGGRGTLTYASAGHPPPILAGFDASEPLAVCCSPPVGWDVPTGRRQTTISLPAGAVVCFFSDGLIEARIADGLMGRERLAETLAELGPRPSSSDLLERVREIADSTPDDMVSCILAPQVGVAGADSRIEELEVDMGDLESENVERFLAACEVPMPQMGRALVRARRTLATGETALLRVTHPGGDGRAAVAVLAGVGAHVDAPAPNEPSAGAPLAGDVATALAGRSAHASGGTA